eukprot:518504_1
MAYQIGPSTDNQTTYPPNGQTDDDDIDEYVFEPKRKNTLANLYVKYQTSHAHIEPLINQTESSTNNQSTYPSNNSIHFPTDLPKKPRMKFLSKYASKTTNDATKYPTTSTHASYPPNQAKSGVSDNTFPVTEEYDQKPQYDEFEENEPLNGPPMVSGSMVNRMNERNNPIKRVNPYDDELDDEFEANNGTGWVMKTHEETQQIIVDPNVFTQIESTNCNNMNFDAFFKERKQRFEEAMFKETTIQHTNNTMDENTNNIRIVSWNIWYNSKLDLPERIIAISRVLSACNCDIVFLQEATWKSMEMLKQTSWYKDGKYQSIDIRNRLAFGIGHRQYWNVIISKHKILADQLKWKVFYETSTIRHLIVVPIKMETKTIQAATTHLKSAVSWNARNKDNGFVDRKKELKCCIDMLDDEKIYGNNDIIFVGDMNWIEKTDGDIETSLSNGWQNAEYDGNTYDGKTNLMLSNTLQSNSKTYIGTSIHSITCVLCSTESLTPSSASSNPRKSDTCIVLNLNLFVDKVITFSIT